MLTWRCLKQEGGSASASAIGTEASQWSRGQEMKQVCVVSLHTLIILFTVVLYDINQVIF